MTVSARSLANVRLKVTPSLSATKATQPVAEAGTDNSAFMTSLRTKQSIDVNAEGADFTPVGTGAEARSIQTKLREIVSPEDYGAVGDGVADDTAAFDAATAVARHVRGTPGRTYVLGDFTPTTNATIDLTGCYIRRATGASRMVDLGVYRGTLIGGDYNGQDVWVSTTTSAGASAAATTISVTSATGLQVGMRCAYASNWRGGRELNEITGIVGTTVTLAIPLRGNVASGAPFLADFPLIRMKGASFNTGSFRDAWVRNCLFGVQKGETGVSSSNSFGSIRNIRVSEFIGAGLLLLGNNAGEAFTDFSLNGGRTQTASFTATAAQTRFAYPWLLSKIPSRWGTERTITISINGSAVTAANYTVDTSTAEVVLSVGASAGDAVLVSNYEFAAFGIWANSANRLGGSSLERLTSGIVIAASVGCFIESSELGFFGNVISDTCSYAAMLVSGSRDMQFAGCAFMFAPFPLIVDAASNNINVGVFKTSLMPDAAELTPTASKKEVWVESGATNVNIDYLSWQSATYVYDVPVTTMGSGRKVTIHPNGLFINAAPSASLIAINGTGGVNGLGLSADGKTLNFGNTGFNYLQNGSASATMRIGAVGVGGKTELACGAGVAVEVAADAVTSFNANRIHISASTGPRIQVGTNTPEAAVTAPVGSLFLRTNGGAATTLYVKESGTGNTGWVAK